MNTKITTTVERVKVVKLTEAECRKALDYLKNIQNVIQVYVGEVNAVEIRIAIQELIQIGHMVESMEQLLKTAIAERLYEEALIAAAGDV
jgi:D-serine dehydratase